MITDFTTLVAENTALKAENAALRAQVEDLLSRLDTNKGVIRDHEERLVLAQKTSTDLQAQCDLLREENKKIKQELQTLQLEYTRLQKEYNQLMEKNDALNARVGTLERDHGALERDHGALERDHGALARDHGALARDHGALARDHGALKQRFEEKVERVNGIDVREAMRSLENWIAVQLVGSKAKARAAQLFTLKQLQQSAYANDIPLSECEIQWLNYYKEMGDYLTHGQLTNNSTTLLEMMYEEDDKEEDIEAKRMLVTRLKDFCDAKKVPFGLGPFSKTETVPRK